MRTLSALSRGKFTRIIPSTLCQYSGTVQKERPVELPQEQPAGGFWPPGPPSFHRDPVVIDEANRLYNNVLRQYKFLGRKPRQDWADPWSKREEWRYHPYFSGANILKNAFPGFSWALIAFGVYCGYEHLSNPAKNSQN